MDAVIVVDMQVGMLGGTAKHDLARVVDCIISLLVRRAAGNIMLLPQWVARRSDLVAFEIVAVVRGRETAAALSASAQVASS